jgi:electron transfer flavoprotein beta subunit
MKALVAVKRVVDISPRSRIQVRADGSGVDLSQARRGLNPFDEVAVEAALRLKDDGWVDQVVVVSCGPEGCEETLRLALGMGADRAIHVQCDDGLEPLAVAKLLRAVAAHEAPDLVLLGKKSVDGECSQTGPMLAALLGWPQATFASRLVGGEAASASGQPGAGLQVLRQVDGGVQTLAVTLPAVVTVDLTLGRPRYITMPGMVAAKRKALLPVTPKALGVDIAPRQRVLRVREPERRPAGERLGDVAGLVERLQQRELC